MRIEQRIKEQWEHEGWTCFIKGMPDMIAYHVLPDGHTEIKIREIKGPGDKLRPEQKEVLTILQTAGVDARVLWTATNTESFGVPITTVVPATITKPRPVIKRTGGMNRYECPGCGKRNFQGRQPLPSERCSRCFDKVAHERLTQGLCFGAVVAGQTINMDDVCSETAIVCVFFNSLKDIATPYCLEHFNLIKQHL